MPRRDRGHILSVFSVGGTPPVGSPPASAVWTPPTTFMEIASSVDQKLQQGESTSPTLPPIATPSDSDALRTRYASPHALLMRVPLSAARPLRPALVNMHSADSDAPVREQRDLRLLDQSPAATSSSDEGHQTHEIPLTDLPQRVDSIVTFQDVPPVRVGYDRSSPALSISETVRREAMERLAQSLTTGSPVLCCLFGE